MYLLGTIFRRGVIHIRCSTDIYSSYSKTTTPLLVVVKQHVTQCKAVAHWYFNSLYHNWLSVVLIAGSINCWLWSLEKCKISVDIKGVYPGRKIQSLSTECHMVRKCRCPQQNKRFWSFTAKALQHSQICSKKLHKFTPNSSSGLIQIWKDVIYTFFHVVEPLHQLQLGS